MALAMYYFAMHSTLPRERKVCIPPGQPSSQSTVAQPLASLTDLIPVHGRNTRRMFNPGRHLATPQTRLAPDSQPVWYSTHPSFPAHNSPY
jgi:hypothetical protein